MASSVVESFSSSPRAAKPSGDDGVSHAMPKDWKFWCIIFSLALSILLTAVEFVSCPFFNALPPPGKARPTEHLNSPICRLPSAQRCRRLPAAWRASSSYGSVLLMPWARLPLYLFVEDWHRCFFLLFCKLESPDLRPQILGRRPIMLSAIMLFALGSTICGAASSMNMLIAGRGSSCTSPTVRCLS